MINELTEDNFMMYAIKNYDNPSCIGMDEFLDDLKRFKYIKRLLRKHNVGKELKERLILNHIIVLGNLFGIEATTKMLFFKLEEKFWPQVKTFLVFFKPFYRYFRIRIYLPFNIADFFQENII